MPVIREYLQQLLRDQLRERRVVVWYDPPGEYGALAAALRPDDLADAHEARPARLARYDPARGYLALRRDVEADWAADEPPRLLLYVADAPPAAPNDGPLLEFEAVGVTLRPGADRPERDTALAAVARRALADRLPAAQLARLAAELAAGQLTLVELEQVVDDSAAGLKETLFLIFPEAHHPTDLVLAFLADARRDAAITDRKLEPRLAQLLEQVLGAPFAETAPAELRAAAARRVLLTDLALALGDAAPPLIAAAEPAAARAAAELAADWRAREPLAAAYEAQARSVETAVGLAARLPAGLPWSVLARAETFAATEARLQAAVAEALLAEPDDAALAVAEARLDGFWSRRLPESRGRWRLLLAAGRLRQQATRVRAWLRGRKGSAVALWTAYVGEADAVVETGNDAPLCLLDRYQRHLERDALALDLDDADDALSRLVARARDDYTAAAGQLAERFVRAYEADGFGLRGALGQAETYDRAVQPLTFDGPTAYILVDALRYEMAHELRQQLALERPTALHAAVATPPTITEVGMAALMPGAEKGLVMSEDKGALRVVVVGAALRTRQERLAYFAQAVPRSVALRLSDLTPLSNKTRNRLKDVSVALITATDDIDGLWENVPDQARKTMDNVFAELRRALGVLFRHGFRAAVITADHGFLFGPRLEEADTMAPPDGPAIIKKRRVWLGRGGAVGPGALRQPLSAFAIAGEAGEPLELVTPYGLAGFKTAGGLQYFHGGLSLPELAVPVLTVWAGEGDAPRPAAKLAWTLRPGTPTIASQVLTVAIEARAEGLLALEPPRVTVEVRAGGAVISTLLAADAGYQPATGDILPQPDADQPGRLARATAILQLTRPPAAQSATIHLLEAATGLELARLDAIAINLIH